MTTVETTQHLIWRRIFISSEVFLARNAVIVRILGRYPSGALQFIGIAAFIACAFLFSAGLFFIGSHRRLAIIGWCIAVAALFLSRSVSD